ncbi:MAG: hypothetical protein B6D41_14745 [Chloroflexi bacterium UTCFX4]|nr:MAG: hypothetical protein B6D41_14745 [Chloroflexi bacterium UTCFX4]
MRHARQMNAARGAAFSRETLYFHYHPARARVPHRTHRALARLTPTPLATSNAPYRARGA